MTVKGWTGLAPATVLFFLFMEAAVLSLMGRHQYGMNALLMLLFALCGTLMLVHGSLSQILFSEGIKTARPLMFLSWGAGLFNLIACLLLIPCLGVSGAALAFVLTYSLMVLWLFKAKDRYLDAR